MKSSLVKIFRPNAADKRTFEIKDPSIVPMPDGTFTLYATIFGSGIPDQDKIGRFHSSHPKGPWKQLESARVHGLSGPEICAPQVLLSEEGGKPLWTMYVQTKCFEEDGIIAVATSRNGIDYYALPVPVMTKESVKKNPVVGLYDVSVSDIKIGKQKYQCMVFSGYRHLKSGDLYMSLRKSNDPQSTWSMPQLILKQENVPFHNKPDSKNFEWGLEGAKIIQIAENSFLLVGVCFLEKDLRLRGTRQRVFFATAETPAGPYKSYTLPIEPVTYKAGQGENGHPDIIDLGDRLALLYQERAGEGLPWHLRYAEISKQKLGTILRSPIP